MKRWLATRRTGLARLVSILACLIASSADAQQAPHRMLETLELTQGEKRWEIRIGFGAAIRYIRHTPKSRGDTVEIQIGVIATSPLDAPSLDGHESLRAPANAPIPLVDVAYEGRHIEGPFVVLHFSRPVSFEVGQSAGLRTLSVTVLEEPGLGVPPEPVRPLPLPPPMAPPSPTPAPVPPLPPTPSSSAAATSPIPAPVPGGFAVQIRAVPQGSALPTVPSGALPSGARVYGVPVESNGAVLTRVRVGPFPDRAIAGAAQSILASKYPDAFVVALTDADRTAIASAEGPPQKTTPAIAPERPPAPTPMAAVPTAPTPAPPAPTPALPAPTPALPAPTTASSEQAAQAATLLASGRAALEAGDLDTAIADLGRVLALPENPASPDAKELLGVARERNGQLAHAKAEYEEYLARYPNTDGATRVRQRLDALLTAALQKLPKSGGEGDRRSADARSTFNSYGSLSTSYRREVLAPSNGSSTVTDSSLFTDISLVAKGRTAGLDLRGQMAGAYRFDLAHGPDENDARVSALFVDARQQDGAYFGTLGRQPGNTAGVFSRFDGLRFGRWLGEHWKLSLLGGLPVEYQTSDRVDARRYLYGVSLDGVKLLSHLDGQLFGIQQRAQGLLDRSAVGGELRWADESKFGSAFVDYDVSYHSLNTALLVGSWQILSGTNLNVLVDYRNSPALTTWNALLGQNADDLRELRRTYSSSEIRDLARDRTARSTTGSVGGTQQLLVWLQFAVDVSGSNLSGTPASGTVDATESTGWEFAYLAQLIATGLLTEGDVTTLGARYFDGSSSKTYSMLLNHRYPLTRNLRLLPRVRVDWRTRAGTDEFAVPPDQQNDPFFRPPPTRNGQLTVRPYLGIEYRLWKLTFDSDAGVEWTSGAFTPGTGSQLDYSLSVGVRYDF